jgi:hypothetical protein
MSMEKNNPAGASDDPTSGQTESLESTEIQDVDLEKVSGGYTMHPVLGTSRGIGCGS